MRTDNCATRYWRTSPTRFSETYFEARQKFLELAKSVKSYKSPARGPGAEGLFTKVAWFGNPDAPHVGVLVSAAHGVEGFREQQRRCSPGGRRASR
ncbi:DUF2817 domain-containing protein [Mesorhizobium sp. M0621]|uniref:DUF2817 domain-containing protein n=1 Tax=Mesorhizobium sp. M0621 TaxID=2956974 RepID=UPI00333BF34F